jgi:anti-sigma factor RsiW
MKCRQVLEMISAYLDDELEPAIKQDIASHLSKCSDCRRELEAFSMVDELLKGLPRYDPPVQFAQGLVSRVFDNADSTQSTGLLHRAAAPMFRFFETYFALLAPGSSPTTHTLDEFDDIPMSFLGYAYFKALGESK